MSINIQMRMRGSFEMGGVVTHADETIELDWKRVCRGYSILVVKSALLLNQGGFKHLGMDVEGMSQQKVKGVISRLYVEAIDTLTDPSKKPPWADFKDGEFEVGEWETDMAISVWLSHLRTDKGSLLGQAGMEANYE